MMIPTRWSSAVSILRRRLQAAEEDRRADEQRHLAQQTELLRLVIALYSRIRTGRLGCWPQHDDDLDTDRADDDPKDASTS